MSGVKLTKAQGELLTLLGRKPIETSRTYRPSIALIYAGLAAWRQPINHIKRTRWLEITPAGRAALSTKTEGGE